MKRLITILLLLFTFSSANAQRAGWWYGNAPGEAAAGPDTLTLTYWNDFIVLYIANKGITEDVNGVSQWGDRSGSGNHATQSVNANKPTTDVDGNIVFDGTNDFLTFSDPFATASVSDSAFTIFCVYQTNGITDNSKVYELNDQGTDGGFFVFQSSDTINASEFIVFVGVRDELTGANWQFNLDTLNLNTTILHSSANSINTTTEHRLNGVEKRSQDNTSDGNSLWYGTNEADSYVLGSQRSTADQYFDGKILFWGIANRKFTPAEIATTESELNSFFTIY